MGTEDADTKALRRQATDALGLHFNTKYLVCASHGVRARVEEVYTLNNVIVWEEGSITCDPEHPHCWPRRKLHD